MASKEIMKKIKATPTLAKVKVETVLVLRTCAADGSSSYGFKWPESGPVEATDWKPTEECGNGLHGWLWGHGDWSLKAKAEKIKWLVLEVDKSSLIDLCGKVKFPKANVVASFLAWNDAMVFIRARHVTGATTIATGNSGHASATGNSGHASATGDSGWAIGGYHSRVKADNNGVLTALWWSDKDQRPRVAVAYVGENGIKADAWYGVDAKGEFLEVKE